MRRRPLLIGGLTLLFLVGGGLTALYALLRHEPERYRRALVPPGPQRLLLSKQFETKYVDLHQEIGNPDVGEWYIQFSDQQLNSWLLEDFIRNGLVRELPHDVSDPRVLFEPGKVFLAFRYGQDQWSSVVSIEARVWISPHEANVVAVEIEELRAGALPLTPKVLQDRITEAGRHQNIDIQWYRSDEGNPVALLRFQADKREPNFQLQELEVGQGLLHVKGRSLHAGEPRAAAALPGTPRTLR